MKTLFAVIHYDYEDPSRSGVEFIGLSEDECYKFIDENFEDYYSGKWNEGPFEAEEMGKDWIKNELHLEVVDLAKSCTLSEDLAGLVKVYHEDKEAERINSGEI